MTKSTTSKLLAVFRPTMVGILTCAGILAPTAAFATSYFSWSYYGPVNGVAYKNQAILFTLSSQIQAETLVQTQNGSYAPAGWIGSNPRVFNSGGTLVADGGYTFSTSSTPGFGAAVGYSRRGTYYSWGVSAAWNGSGYNYYYTYQSPWQTW